MDTLQIMAANRATTHATTTIAATIRAPTTPVHIATEATGKNQLSGIRVIH
jgi:hypothetical protein